eukprot:324473-Amphidinium_carterae.3
MLEEAIVDYFSKRVVPLNRKRENLRDHGDGSYSRSLLLGLYTVRGVGLSRATHAHPDLLKLCHRLAAQRPVDLRTQYLSIMVNENPHVPYHKDANNEGPSWLRAFGDYNGGFFHQDHAAGIGT